MPHPICGTSGGVPWVLCFFFEAWCTLSGTGAGAITWCGFSWKDGAWVPCKLGAPILWASLQEVLRQSTLKDGGRKEHLPIPWLTALTSHPGLGQSPQGALKCMPWVLQAACLPPRASAAERGGCAPAGGSGAAGCCPSLPPPKDVPLSASSAPIAIATGSALGYPLCRLPHPAAILPTALASGPRGCQHGTARPALHSVVLGEL